MMVEMRMSSRQVSSSLALRAGLVLALGAGLSSVLSASESAGAPAAHPASLAVPTRYEQEYPHVGYAGPATHNRVWKLQQDLEAGRVKLQWEDGAGYLRSLLRALDIDPASQVLVFSSTSLQFSDISASTPRAIYFNDDTYVGHVPSTGLLEIASIDVAKGPVFHVLENRQEGPARPRREGNECLSCHDTFSMTGGGVPRVVVMSTPVDDPRDGREWSSASETDDRTPLDQRWGGWYVTGSTGGLAHFGNLPLREQKRDARLRELRGRRNPRTLDDYIDTTRHLTPHSDVVALLVLEHQTFVQNLITRIAFKVPQLAPGSVAARSWDEVPAADARRAAPMLDALVRALFFHEAAPLGGRIEGSSGFTQAYQQRGPRDAQGRSLRQLDLAGRLFRHRLSPEVYSPQLAALPPFALDYIQRRIVEVIDGTDTRGIAAGIPEEERAVIRAILLDTHPALAARLAVN